MKYNLQLSLSFVSTLSFAKLWNSMLIRCSYLLSKLFGRYLHWGNVESLSIEPTNLCNLKCPECPSGNNKMKRARLFLSKEEFENAIDNSYKYLVYLQLYFQGEPFMHPKLCDFIGYATGKKVFTTTSTNGHFLNQETCQKIVDSGLHQLIVSIDGTTQESYEKYRVGGSLDKVKAGIEMLQNVKDENKSNLPHIVIQFVVFSSNENQINDIKDMAKELQVSDLRLKSAQIEDFHEGNTLMPKNLKYNRYSLQNDGTYILKRKNDFKCFRVWNGSVISANNELLPCCFDKDAKHAYNDGATLGINANWKNDNAVEFRKKVWKNSKQFEMCRNCTEGLKRTWFFQ